MSGTASALPALPPTADVRSITERLNVLIRNYNSGDFDALAARVTALEALANGDTTVFLGADVGTGTAGVFANGPNTGAIGGAGQRWLLSGTATLSDIADAEFVVEIHNGTAGVVNTTALLRGSAYITASVAAVVTLSAATTFTLRVADETRN